MKRLGSLRFDGVLGLADVLLDGDLNEDQREFVEALRVRGGDAG